MASTGQRYALGIGTGAAGGAASGSAFGPWGTAIGAGVGAIGGAVGAGMANSEEERKRKLLEIDEARRKKSLLMNVLRNEAQKYGADTGLGDTLAAKNNLDYDIANEQRDFTAQNRIDPNAFMQMAQLGTQAGGTLYDRGSKSEMADAQKQLVQLQLAQYGGGNTSGRSSAPTGGPSTPGVDYPSLQLDQPSMLGYQSHPDFEDGGGY